MALERPLQGVGQKLGHTVVQLDGGGAQGHLETITHAFGVQVPKGSINVLKEMIAELACPEHTILMCSAGNPDCKEKLTINKHNLETQHFKELRGDNCNIFKNIYNHLAFIPCDQSIMWHDLEECPTAPGFCARGSAAAHLASTGPAELKAAFPPYSSHGNIKGRGGACKSPSPTFQLPSSPCSSAPLCR